MGRGHRQALPPGALGLCLGLKSAFARRASVCGRGGRGGQGPGRAAGQGLILRAGTDLDGGVRLATSLGPLSECSLGFSLWMESRMRYDTMQANGNERGRSVHAGIVVGHEGLSALLARTRAAGRQPQRAGGASAHVVPGCPTVPGPLTRACWMNLLEASSLWVQAGTEPSATAEVGASAASAIAKARAQAQA